MSRTKSCPRCCLQVEMLEDRLVPTGDMVIQWNEIMRDTVRLGPTPATAASRVMAITQAAMYDSVNALARTHEVYLVDALAHPEASREAAVASAAHRALIAFYPAQAGALNGKLESSLATIPDGKAEDDGVALGKFVAEQILALRQNDGAGVVLPPYLGAPGPGQWRPTPPSNAPALHPHWVDVTPFAMDSKDQFRPQDPPALDSAEYTAAFNEVKELGSATSATRTANQTDIARFWANGAGTATPIGHLNLMAQVVAIEQGNTLEENARMFAVLNVALADAVISCWEVKFETNYWRPIAGIREAATDGNADTEADAVWTPLLGTPNFPSYTSGHSTVSAAAAVVLADFFGTDDISFTLPSQNAAIAARSFDSFSEAAAESAVSRLYGGIHWSFDNNVGLAQGAALGEFVVANVMRPAAQTPAAGVVNGELIVIGTDGQNVFNVERIGSKLVVWANGTRLGSFDRNVTGIVMDGRDGNDVLRVSHLVDTDTELYGGAGNDILLGGGGDDRLEGGAGHDFLFGGLGDDVLLGGLGDDWLFGGPGLDVLDGGLGKNRLFA